MTEWPGWCRAGRDELRALDALVAYGPRYRPIASLAGLDLVLPDSADGLRIIERVRSSATTDFGAPARLAVDDTRPLTAPEIDRLARLLVAYWSFFDAVLCEIPEPARSVQPEVGRSPAQMRQHLLDADVMHLSAFGPAYREPPAEAIDRLEPVTRSRLLAAFRSVSPGQAPAPVRRYGFEWTPRFAVRRSAWHALDHAWQLQDQFPNAVVATRPG